MSIFEKFGFIAAAGRGSRPPRPRIPGKVRAWFPGVVGMTARDNGAGHSDEQASRPPMVAASFNSGDQQA